MLKEFCEANCFVQRVVDIWGMLQEEMVEAGLTACEEALKHMNRQGTDKVQTEGLFTLASWSV